MENKVIVFGVGKIGHIALERYGLGNVLYFIDNNEGLWGKTVDGIPVKKVESAIEDSLIYPIVIASKSYELMERQLIELGIKNYSIFKDALRGYFVTDSLVFNPYEENEQRGLSEEEWVDNLRKKKIVEAVNFRVEQLYQKDMLFDHVEIETINRCNGSCDFCPVSKKKDIRKFHIMEKELFEDIIRQLAKIDYSGRLALFSNNEPFLDKAIIDRHRYAREKLPNARMHLFTNGTLLTIDKFVEIIGYLDELVIDNYHQELKLIKPCEEIRLYCEIHPELKKKVTIVLRDPHEILTTRGGDAPNRKKMVSYGQDRCVLPFKQLIIRPDGKVSLCCNDPYGKNTLGDLTKESLVEVWNNSRFKMVRECLYMGRKNWKHCEFCDTFNLG